jgi:hypothetical protein
LLFPLLLIFFINYCFKFGILTKEKIKKVLHLYTLLIPLSLIIGFLTGFGGEIAKRGTLMDGTKGFMIGANEVGLMLLLTSSFLGSFLINFIKYQVFNSIVSVILYSVCGIMVFTKSSIISVFVNLLSECLRTFKIYNKKTVSFFVTLLVVILFFLIISLKDSIIELGNQTFFSSLLQNNYLDFLFRGRISYVEAIYFPLVSSCYNWFYFLFGAGEFIIRHTSEIPLQLAHGKGSTFEMDLFDLFGFYGVFGTVCYITCTSFCFFNLKPKFPLYIKICLFCTLIHSLLAGHVVFSPQVTTIVVLITSFYSNKHNI